MSLLVRKRSERNRNEREVYQVALAGARSPWREGLGLGVGGLLKTTRNTPSWSLCVNGLRSLACVLIVVS